MQIDAEQLRDFYASSLGGVVRRLIGRKIRARWRNVYGDVFVGLGFASPYMSVFRDEVRSVTAFMPARQGGVVLPRVGPVKTVLVDEEMLPLPDNSVDHFLIVHGLENCGYMHHYLREVWRVLAPSGRLLIVVPNRRGMWSRIDNSPFGFGNPLSRGQLERLLLDACFMPTYWDSALHVPPMNYRFMQKSAVGWERIGTRVISPFAGVLLVEATKEVTAPTGLRDKTVRKKSATVLQPSARRVSSKSLHEDRRVNFGPSKEIQPARQISSEASETGE